MKRLSTLFAPWTKADSSHVAEIRDVKKDCMNFRRDRYIQPRVALPEDINFVLVITRKLVSVAARYNFVERLKRFSESVVFANCSEYIHLFK